jgi:hypothetical protein
MTSTEGLEILAVLARIERKVIEIEHRLKDLESAVNSVKSRVSS